MANNRLAFGLCKEYGIDLPKDATPTDAWKALEDKGITQDEAFQKASKSTKQGTSYDDILKGESKKVSLSDSDTSIIDDAVKELDKKGMLPSRDNVYEQLDKDMAGFLGNNKEAVGEYVDKKYGDIIKKEDEEWNKRVQGRNYAMKRASEIGIDIAPWELDDFFEGYDYDGDYSEESIDKYMDKVKAELVKDDAYSDIIKDEDPIDSQMNKLFGRMTELAADYGKYKRGTPEYDKWDKEYNDVSSQYEKLQKQKYPRLR